MGEMLYGNENYSTEDTKGMSVTSGTVTLERNETNMIGVSIGGGAQYCPCLYVVQIFDNTPAAKEGSLAAGDELVAVNGESVKGFHRNDVAKLIQASPSGPVTIWYNKLHADPKQGETLDMVMKKVKHKLVENMAQSTADLLGLSRAVLINEAIVKRHSELERIAEMYKGLVNHTGRVLKAFFNLSQANKNFGEVFCCIGYQEPFSNAGEAFVKFGNAHKKMEKYAIDTLKKLKPMISDLNTYLTKAVPDTRLTIKKYLKVKFEYLSYCLKVRDMDDEEYAYNLAGESLDRVETGNYEYRLVLRCRQQARKQFAKLRADVLVKIELLDNKHVQDTVVQLQKFVSAIARYHTHCFEVMNGAAVFPIEVDLFEHTFSYNPSGQINDCLDGEEADTSLVDAVADLHMKPAAPSGQPSVDDLLDLS